MKPYYCSVVFALFFQFLLAQVEPESELYRTILSKDSLLFNVGFNTCDIRQFELLLSADFEFIHDLDSISDRNRFLTQLKQGLCQSPTTYQSRRELLRDYTKIYPLYKNNVLYGAIQEGRHRFYENIEGQEERLGSTALFTHVWLLENGNWKLHRSLSFDHQVSPAPPVSTHNKDGLLPKPVDWLGTWMFEDTNATIFQLSIEGKFKGMHLCTLTVTGFQLFYSLDCRAVSTPDSIEIYFWGLRNGDFDKAAAIDRDHPIFTLKKETGKITTYWNQLETNGQWNDYGVGKVSFIKR